MTVSVDIISQFRQGQPLAKLSTQLKQLQLPRKFRLMEVCGTHTMSIFRHGIRSLLPDKVELLSGPGCPVCVTPDTFIDRAIAIGQQHNVILATFGDMLRVPGSQASLDGTQELRGRVKVVYGQHDVLQLAKDNPEEKIVFLSVGFETTTPGSALMLRQAAAEKIDNLFVLVANKLIPPAMQALLENRKSRIDGFLLPAHVSTIIGLEPYRFLQTDFSVPGVIAGFEPLDLIVGIHRLLTKLGQGDSTIENAYSRVARDSGNPTARQVVEEVFTPAATAWRGLGVIPQSGLVLNEKYQRFDAGPAFPVNLPQQRTKSGCRCGEVLQGLIVPSDCPLFGQSCLPHQPFGPCMVSREGTCAAHYKYGGETVPGTFIDAGKQ